MKLTIKCPKCNKDVKGIQSEFPVGNLVCYVYTCGHIETRERLVLASPTQADSDLINALEASLDMQEHKKNIESAFPQQLPLESAPELRSAELAQVPAPTKSELYEDLDRWVSDGGYVKPLEQDLSLFSCDMSKNAYPFQAEGVKFIESTGFNALVADAMGLGKTIQALLTLKKHKAELTPTLICVKGATLFQWAKELSTWVDPKPFAVMPVTHRSHLMPGFQFYIISIDFLGRKGVSELLVKLNLKCIVLDEVQNFKDASSLRTTSLIKLITESKIQHRIALSGTPIKNRADEYFTILNLLDPMHFRSLAQFRRSWLCQNEKGAYTRLNPVYLEEFKRVTSKYIIRRERHEVLKNLPALTRDWQIIEIEDPLIKNSYNQTLDLFKNFLNTAEHIGSQDILGWLAKLRAITGYAKIIPAIEWIQEFLESSDESLSVGVHHHSVRDALFNSFDQKGIKTLKLSGEDNTYRKADIVRRFTNGENRLLVLNSLAGGVGLNLQTCANALVLERQWNNADEEQFEARFHRDGQQKAVTITYMIAKGTIDEWFHDLVYSKSHILADAGIGESRDETQSMGFLKEFAEMVVNGRLR